MKDPFCLLVYDGCDLSAFKGPFLIYGKICGKTGKSGFPDQFMERKGICLYQEPGGGHLLSAHIAPESQLAAQQEIISVELGKGKLFISGKCMGGRQAHIKVFF